MARKKDKRLGRMWIREVPEGQPAQDAPPADLDRLWQKAYSQAISAGNGDEMARRIADDVVRQLKARDNEKE